MNYEKLKIMGTFKSGTHSLSETFIINDINVSRHHLQPLDSNTCYFVPIRNQKEIFLSAYFQDILHPRSYEYSLLNHLNIDLSTIDETDLKKTYLDINKNKYFYEKLYETFKKTDWDKYEYLSNKYCLNLINKIDDSFKTIPFKKNYFTIHNIPNKNISIVFLDIKIINDKEILNEMFKKLKLKYNINNISYSNIGSTKFYANEYAILHNKLKIENYFDENYYDFLNPSIFTNVSI